MSSGGLGGSFIRRGLVRYCLVSLPSTQRYKFNGGLSCTGASTYTWFDIDPDEVYILPQEFYSEEYTFFGHSPGGTWHEEDVAVVLWFVARPWLIMVIVSSLVLVCVAFAYRQWRKKRRGAYKRVDTGMEMEEATGVP